MKMKTSVLDSLDKLIIFYKTNSPKNTLFDLFIEATESVQNKTKDSKNKEDSQSNSSNSSEDSSELDIDKLLSPEKENNKNSDTSEGDLNSSNENQNEEGVENKPNSEENASSPEENKESVLGQLKNEKEILNAIKSSVTLLFRKIEKELMDESQNKNNEDKLNDFYTIVGNLPGDEASEEDWKKISEKLKQWIRLSLDEDFFNPSV